MAKFRPVWSHCKQKINKSIPVYVGNILIETDISMYPHSTTQVSTSCDKKMVPKFETNLKIRV
jgi:hypothetical protein